MSDTPETDALREAIDNGAATEAEMTSLAGKLERERNSLQDQRDFAMGEIERLRKERDQARRELDIQLESIKFHMERVPVREHPLRADDAKLCGEMVAK